MAGTVFRRPTGRLRDAADAISALWTLSRGNMSRRDRPCHAISPDNGPGIVVVFVLEHSLLYAGRALWSSPTNALRLLQTLFSSDALRTGVVVPGLAKLLCGRRRNIEARQRARR